MALPSVPLAAEATPPVEPDKLTADVAGVSASLAAVEDVVGPLLGEGERSAARLTMMRSAR